MQDWEGPELDAWDAWTPWEAAERFAPVDVPWVLDVEAQLWRLDVMLEPGDADTWIFRRDESITAPRSFMVERDVRGVPSRRMGRCCTRRRRRARRTKPIWRRAFRA